MSIFKFGKNKDVKSKGCSCEGNRNENSMKEAKEKQNSGARVKILGSGCAKCNELEKNVVEALKQLGYNTEVDHITDFSVIASYGVMTTPAVVVDGKVISYGKVLKVYEAISLLNEFMN